MTTPAGLWVQTGGQWVRGGQAPVTPPPATTRFFGDPGVGKVIIGSTVKSSVVTDGFAWLSQNTGVPQRLARRYGTDLWSRSEIVSDHNSGRWPFYTFKLNATQSNAANILAGSRDADLTAEAQWAAQQGYSILASFYHEPEDNWSSDAAASDYRAIFRRIVGIFNDNGASNVVWVGSIYVAPYTFTAPAESSRGGWFKWDPDWAGTKSGTNGRPTSSDWYTGTDAVVTLLGFDQYCPEVNTTGYRDLSTQFGPVLSKIAGDGRVVLPWVIPEFGTTLVTSTSLPLPGDGWTGYYQRALRYMRDNQGVGFTVFNTFPKYNMVSGDDHAARLAGYTAALTSEASYLVTG